MCQIMITYPSRSLVLLCLCLALSGASQKAFEYSCDSPDTYEPGYSDLTDKDKVQVLGSVLKTLVTSLRNTPNRKVDLVFLVDSSGSVGREHFLNELKFVRKLLADFTVDVNTTRVAVVTFSSPKHVKRHIDHISRPSEANHKCSILQDELPLISYTGGGTYTLGAVLEAKNIFRQSRDDARKAVFLVTDGYSNGGDPKPAAEDLKRQGVEIFTIGIRNGNFRELCAMATEPKDEHTYIVNSFEEFEALARRALHEDLQTGSYIEQAGDRCHYLCDTRASCSCGSHTGMYECVCNRGYYGTGLKAACTPCPAGTYKNTSVPGDQSTCVPCPDEHHTSPEASTSVLQCTCVRGYHSEHRPGVPHTTCAAMTCPELTAPENGYFIHEHCSNVFNAACGMRCHPGYELTGSSLRLCTDNGTWSGTTTACVVKKCESLQPPSHGYMKCSTNDFSFGTQCDFGCKVGFKMVGSVTRKCTAAQYWSGIPPSCKEIVCNPLPMLVDGIITPDTCTTQPLSFGTVCSLTCLPGYKMVGHYSKLCSHSGQWVPKDITENLCIDVQPPVINCPGNITLEADEGENSALVSWSQAQAIDNSVFLPTLTVIPALESPARLPIGQTRVTYVAEDMRQNKAKCHFIIHVKDVEPPRVDRCISPPPFILHSPLATEVQVTWHEPLFSDNSRQSVTVIRSHDTGFFSVGTTMVHYNASDRAGNINTCILHITVKEHACANPPQPVHGKLVCETADDLVRCSARCDEGYEMMITPEDTYTCRMDNGTWEPQHSWPIPDCSKSKMSNHVTQNTVMLFHTHLACDDRLQLKRAENMVSHKINSLAQRQCPTNSVCTLKDFTHQCQPNKHKDTTENRPELYSNKIEDLLGISNRRHKRTPISEVTATSNKSNSDVTLSFNVAAMAEGVSISEPIQSALQGTVGSLTQSIIQAASQGQFDIKIEDKDFQFAELESLQQEPQFVCGSGSVLIGKNCVLCAVGTYFNVVSMRCEGCPKGTYQPTEGVLTCMVCPGNTDTSANNSKSLHQCLGRCLPGFYSESGLEVCESCELGYYQPDYAQTECLPCPANTTTWRRGRRHSQECAARCPEGYVSTTGLEPCFPCPVGYFQPQQGQSGCLRCPGGADTPEPASIHLEQCEGLQEVNVTLDNVTSAVVLITECFMEPCHNNGTCVTMARGYICKCLPGYTGLHCESEIDECFSNPCLNNGSCTDMLAGYTCHCPPGFNGSQCEVDIDECLSQPCQNNATCLDAHNGYTCECPNGFNGSQCEQDVDDCVYGQCENGAVCLDGIADYTCVCVDGYTGRNCEIDMDECESTPCKHNADCIDHLNGYSCQCPDGYTGMQCESEIDECESSPCQNGAHCTDHIGSYSCRCLPAYTGTNCQTKLSSAFDLEFPAAGVTDYSTIDDALIYRNLTQITVTFWMITDDSANYGTPVSYATDLYDNAVTIMDYSGFVLYVNGKKTVTDVTANDGAWHHIGATWSSTMGHWMIYKDGQLEDEGTGLADGEVIASGGTFVLGQEQDHRGAGFSNVESFVGRLSRLHVWNYTLTAEDIEEMRTSCDKYMGNVIAWPDFLQGLQGQLHKQPSKFCKGCDMPKNISNGLMEVNSTEPNSLVRYSCNPGFELMGTAEQMCGVDSTWTGETPTCRRKRCEYPGLIANGLFIGYMFQYGHSVQYRCYKGFILTGNGTLNCNASGLWQGERPRCIEALCLLMPLEESLLQVQDSKPKYKPGDTMRVTCPVGYDLVGSKSLKCSDNGQWNKPFPQCVPVLCTDPPTVAHAKLLNNRTIGHHIGDSVEYTCNTGYRLETRYSRVTCTADGSWSSMPSCTIIYCGAPAKMDNAFIIGANYSYSSVVQYQCENGYNIIGDGYLKCLADGQWNGSLPVCDAVQCPQLDNITNGQVITTDNVYTSTALYLCYVGFTLYGETNRTCLDNGTWSGEPPICTPVECPQPEVILHGYYIITGRLFQDQVEYVCEEGYFNSETAVLQCGPDGKWDHKAPLCQPITCPEPQKIQHGNIIGESFLYNDVIKYSCDIGYILKGESQSACQANGTWSSSQPSCIIVDCGAPDKVDNAVIIGINYSYSSVVQYQCVKGYSTVGDEYLKCHADEQWHGTLPKCEPIQCPQLENITGGQVITTDNTYNSFAIYICDNGFTLEGSSNTTCLDNGTWSSVPAKCTPVECSQPDTIFNGFYTMQGRLYQDRVEYFCEEGYFTNETTVLQCGPDGEWDHMAPSCLPVACPDAEGIINGYILGDSFLYGKTIEYKCDTGYNLDGESHLTCGSNGTWSSPTPSCAIVDCGPPGNVDYADIIGTDFTYGSLVSYQCSIGYSLVGDGHLKCLDNGKWNVSLPRCEQTYCLTPETINNGQILVPNNIFNSSAWYMCDKGFTLHGQPKRTCQENGTWSGGPPECKSVECPEPDIILNGYYKFTGRLYLDQVEYICEEGYFTNETNILQCTSDGFWDHKSPSCSPVACPVPDEILNGNIVGDSFLFKDTIEYKCDTGYILYGDSYKTCLSNATWSSPTPSCIIVDCGPPHRGDNTEILAIDFTYGSMVHYQCNTGYVMIGDQNRTCHADGVWSGEEPVCTRIECPEPSSINHGYYNIKGRKYQDVMDYVCNEGYFPNGTTVLQCNSEGHWDNKPPLCLPVACPQPEVPPNGHIIGDTFLYGDIIEYTCSSGFELNGFKRRKCTSKAKWSDEAPVCKTVKCTDPIPFEHGNYVSKSNDIGTVIKYLCDRGYESYGKGTRTCRVDGTWTGPNPKCVAIHCSLPTPVKHGKFIADDTRYGSTLQYVCDQGYQITGPEQRTCSEDKRWTGDNPSCVEVTCPAPSGLQYGSVNGETDTYSVGSSITYKCEPGFKLVGENTRQCAENQTWTGEKPKCVAVQCQPPSPIIPSGYLVGSNFTYTSSVSYSCDDGFEIKNNPNRTCLSSGEWEGVEPVCEKVMCGMPVIPTNGSIWGYSFFFRDTISYICDTGFELNGILESTCQANKTWSGDVPECLQIVCAEPSKPKHGYILENDVVYMGKVVYGCNEGYKLANSGVRTCQEDKSWSGQEPICSKILCGPSPVINNGKPNEEHTTAGSLVIYTCNAGYKLVTSNVSLKCSLNGTHTGEPPSCVQIQCDTLKGRIANGNALVNGTEMGNTVSYTCDTGYTLVGNNYRVCSASGEWTGLEPVCQVITCGPPPSVPHALVDTVLEKYEYGTNVSYICVAGYTLTGNAIMICLEHGVWTGTIPECTEIECQIQYPENGFITAGTARYTIYDDTLAISVGTSVTIHCRDGYQLQGPNELPCLEDGTWSESTPYCTKVECKELTIQYAMITASQGFSYGSNVSVSCQEGFVLSGPDEIYCTANGTWNEDPPICEPVICQSPGIDNGNLTVVYNAIPELTFSYGTIVNISCNKGYELDGYQQLECAASGDWSNMMPACNPIFCMTPIIDPGHHVILENPIDMVSYGDALSFFCEEGYEMDIYSSLEFLCSDDGIWNGSLPICHMITCSIPNIQFGNSVPGKTVLSVPYNKNISITCDRGYILKGSSSLQCQSDHSWWPSIPVCQPVHCPDIELHNGTWTVMYNSNNMSVLADLDTSQTASINMSLTFQTMINFECNEGYKLEGDSVAQCEDIGIWSVRTPTCTKIKCPGIEMVNSQVIAHGYIILPSSFLYNDTISVECDSGYELSHNTSREIQCTGNGMWSTEIPHCVLVQCSSPVTDHAIIELINREPNTEDTVYYFGDLIRYQCEEGYDIEGSMDNVCLPSKMWLEPLPKCMIRHCPPLTIPNAQYNSSLTTYGSLLEVKCQMGYELFGDGTLSCAADAQWVGSPPSCHIINCPSPKIENGRILNKNTSPGTFIYGETVTFECKEGYDLSGASEISCLPNKTWSAPFPVCTKGICPPVAFVVPRMKATILYSDNYQVLNLGTSIVFECEIGYEITNGTSFITCGPTRKWEGTVPICVQIFCPNPVLENGYIESDPNKGTAKYTYGNRVKFTCSEGFELVGEKDIFCQPNKEWTAAYPTCEKIQCPPPLHVSHGYWDVESYKYESTAQLHCNNGYEVQGNMNVTCLVNSSWSSQPSCERTQCNEVEPPLNGYCLQNGTVFEDNITCYCNRGYELSSGSSERWCQSDSQWSGYPPKCSRVHCGPAPFIPYAIITGNGNQYNDHLSVTCHSGYLLEGISSITCTENGTWSLVNSSCRPVLCPVLSPPVHGYISSSSNAFNHAVQFSCKLGFELFGKEKVTCSEFGNWTSEVPTCRRLNCSHPEFPSYNNIILTKQNSSYLEYLYQTNITSITFEYEDVLTYECYPGYRLHGPNQQLCTHTGHWSRSPPACHRVQCSSVPPIPNSLYINHTDYYAGDRVNVTCRANYENPATGYISCLDDGSWNVTEVVCLKMLCPAEDEVQHGVVLHREYSVGATVLYMCNMGYILEGDNVRTCLPNKTWSGVRPVCNIVHCQPPEAPDSGYTELEALTYNFTVKYTCDTGYRIVGSQYSVCLANGNWSSEAPNCVMVNCTDPPPVSDGYYVETTWQYGSGVNYFCHAGYNMKGLNTAECTENGTWAGEVPTCEPVTCETFITIQNGFVSHDTTHYGSVALVTCSEGYQLRGSGVLVCTEDGTWSAEEVPVCHPVTCAASVVVQNGYATYNSTYGHVHCNKGYELKGNGTLRCLVNGSWTGEDYLCEVITCPVPQNVENGYFIADNYTYNSTIFYSCDRHYKLQGESTGCCHENGVWSIPPPLCVPKQCPEPPILDNGRTLGVARHPGAVVVTVCQDGYRLVGSSSNLCMTTENWKDEFPTCVPEMCGEPKNITNGVWIGGGHEYKAKVVLQCSRGYRLVGDPVRTCQVNGTWSSLKAQCVAVKCRNPPTIANGRPLGGDGYSYGESVVYECMTGYEHQGSALLACGADGRWSGTLPRCTMVNCGAHNLPVIHHASNIVYHTTFGSVVHYDCNEGYKLKGSPMVECMANGTWMYKEKPSCKPVNCGHPPIITHGSVNFTGMIYRQEATYTCDRGHKLHGSKVTQCQASGQWGVTPLCVPVTCPQHPALDHGFVDHGVSTYGQEVHVSCERGYELVGDHTRTCTENGTWSGHRPVCQLVQCENVESPVGGEVAIRDKVVGSKAEFTCVRGYRLVGTHTILCMEDGHWSAPTPKCVPMGQGGACRPPEPVMNSELEQEVPYDVGQVVEMSCKPCYAPTASLSIVCQEDGTWTKPQGTCHRQQCARPLGDPWAVVMGIVFHCGDQVSYVCRRGLQPSSPTLLTCQPDGQWDHQPHCKARCKFECQNGGKCVGPNRCQCPPGFVGRLCEEAVCILPCQNGGRCTSPYHCSCPYGYTGHRCQQPICVRPCENGGHCYQPNRCLCPSGFVPPFCESALLKKKLPSGQTGYGYKHLNTYNELV